MPYISSVAIVSFALWSLFLLFISVSFLQNHRAKHFCSFNSFSCSERLLLFKVQVILEIQQDYLHVVV
jgi:hypothetical protein